MLNTPAIQPAFAKAAAAACGALVLCVGGEALADPCEAGLPAKGATFAGEVRYIGDGDSLCVGPGTNPNTWIEIRLADFYAPELHADGGREARDQLDRLTRGRRLVCVAQHRSYDRIVAQCSLGGVALGELLRRGGGVEGGNAYNRRR